MEKVRLGVIGLGNRGRAMLEKSLVKFEDVQITAICDIYEDRLKRVEDFMLNNLGYAPFSTTDYKEVLNKDIVDAIYIASDWETHFEISIAALRAGVIVGSEVGGAYNLNECYELVRAYEETGTPYMFMENCCFGKYELLATAAARKGLFGTIVHCSGAYAHDLREEVTGGNINRHYRMRNYLNRNCENYPTHDLGPIARLLNVTRGNRLLSLVSVASKACGAEEYVKDMRLYEKDPTLKDARFKQGDIVSTIITCSGGETILLRLDTTLPRHYNRELTVRGTKGLYEMGTNLFYIEGTHEEKHGVKYYLDQINNGTTYYDEFMPDFWLNLTEDQKKTGHGGMDGLMFRVFIDAIKNGTPMPIDVYDGVTWMSITCLSEASIAQGGAPQEIPDFTNGKWLIRKPFDVIDLNK